MARVFIVDDSAVVRQVLTEILESAPGIEVVGAAQDPIFAEKKLASLKQWPDVIILDVEMPRMDGLTFLKKLMSEHPTPVVMCSTLTEKGSRTSMQALASGAVDVIEKPKANVKTTLAEAAEPLIDAIRGAASAKIARMRPQPASSAPAPRPAAPAAATAPAPSAAATPVRSRAAIAATDPAKVAPKLSADAITSPVSRAANYSGRLVAIGTSTGGTQALEEVLKRLPKAIPPMLVVQHMPEKFTAAFAERLDSVCEMRVVEAKDGMPIAPGTVYIAPGGKHMLMRAGSLGGSIEIKDGPPVSRHKPSVDVLFRSVAKAAGKSALGIIMTGMGDDGAAGLKELHDTGATTLGQDENSCVVYGMPMVAMKKGAVDREVDLLEIPNQIMAYAAGRQARA